MRRRYLYYRGWKVTIVRGKYQNNGRLAIMMTGRDPLDAIHTVSVNLDDGLDLEQEYAYLDTNNYPGIEEALLEGGLGVPTGMTCKSGFCRYPMYKFDLSKIPEVKYI